MQLLLQTFLLFALNFLDAVLIIYWVRNGFATEGNQLMAELLDIGDLPFLAVKVAVGGVAAIVLWRWRNLRLAKYGLGLTLAIYIGLMGESVKQLTPNVRPFQGRFEEQRRVALISFA